MTKRPLIAISGKMKAGKTSIATPLSNLLQIPIASFATPLKEGIAAMGVDTRDKEKVRDLYQEIGQRLRKTDPAHWIKVLDRRHPSQEDLETGITLARPGRESTGLLIDDLRSENEFEWCRDNGFFIVRLGISRLEQIERGADASRLDHETETGLDHLDQTEFDMFLHEETSVLTRVYLIVRAMKGETRWDLGL